MNSEQWIAKSDKYVMKNYGRFPLVPCARRGVPRVGRRPVGNIWISSAVSRSITWGHCHPRVVEALRRQAGEMIHCSNLYQIPRQIELAELLCQLSFADRVFFCNSGAEANEAAIKLARKHSRDSFGPERFGIITATDSFHGRTMATVSATGQEKVQRFFDPLLHGFTHVPFNDIAALEAAITPATCAIMLEPIQGESGINIPGPEYFREVRRICDTHKLLLIFDEVQVGMGRTGKMFAYEHFGCTPDIMTLAKALAGGAPIGAMLAREEIAASLTPGTHGSTFGGNPLVCAAAVATIRAIREEGLLEMSRETGAYLMGELQKLAGKYSFVKEVRGIGLMIGMALTIPAGDIVAKGHERGVLLNAVHDTVLRFVPPLIVTKQDIAKMITILDGILAEVEA